jgi:hypothetical protein
MGSASGLPPVRDWNANDMQFEGIDPDPQGPPHNVDFWQFVTDDYLDTMGIEVLSGRGFEAADSTAIGIYGVLSYSVAQRGQELGIRMALGADRRRILGLVLSQGMLLSLLGVVVGLAISLLVSRLIESLLFGVERTDPLTYAGVVTVLGVVALLAGALPAARAARVDPLVVLRSE